jgi:hypothetical protein
MNCLAQGDRATCTPGKTDVGCFCSPEFQYPVFLCVVDTCHAADAQHAVPVLASYGCGTTVRLTLPRRPEPPTDGI